MPALQYPRGFAREASLCLQDLVSSKSIAAPCLGVPTVGPMGTVGQLQEAVCHASFVRASIWAGKLAFPPGQAVMVPGRFCPRHDWEITQAHG